MSRLRPFSLNAIRSKNTAQAIKTRLNKFSLVVKRRSNHTLSLKRTLTFGLEID